MTDQPSQNESLPTDFDDHQPDDESLADDQAINEDEPSKKDKRGGQVFTDLDGVPYCPRHHCRMKRTSGGRKGSRVVYYKCPVKGCESKGQVVRTKVEGVVPALPTKCPSCSAIMERNQKLSNAQMVILECPECSYRAGGMVSPHLAAADVRFNRVAAGKSAGNGAPEAELGAR